MLWRGNLGIVWERCRQPYSMGNVRVPKARYCAPLQFASHLPYHEFFMATNGNRFNTFSNCCILYNYMCCSCIFLIMCEDRWNCIYTIIIINLVQHIFLIVIFIVKKSNHNLMTFISALYTEN